MTIVSLFPHRMAEHADGPMAWHVDAARHVVGRLLARRARMWWVMMIAMMTPSAAPMILLYARATRHAQATGQLQQGAVPTAAFAGGYLMVWLGFSLLAAALQWALERIGARIRRDDGVDQRGRVGRHPDRRGPLPALPLEACVLEACRAPAEFLSRHWRPGASGALRMGLEHGAFCVGCCWILMALLFVGGIMNVLWIAALAILVLLEKVAPHGAWLSRATGVVLLAWGATTLVV